MKIGILALQGAVQPHQEKLRELGIDAPEVRRREDLAGVDGIILPGGESSTMLKLLNINQMWDDFRSFVAEKPAWGICAGAILLAKHVSNPEQESLGAIDMDVERNAYGRQLDSFITDHMQIDKAFPDGAGQEGVFIRAPRFTRLGPSVQTLITCRNDPVMVTSGHILASAFHPELSPGYRVHKYFAELVRQSV